MSQKPLKAALIIIGNEILSGRTQDANTQYIAQKLAGKGIAIVEMRVVPDVAGKIVEAVNALRAQVDYVFTTGGIGPTHDDITAENVAAAFGVKLILDPRAKKILEDKYGAVPPGHPRLKMAMMPEGAELIPNPVSGAPGFVIGNVYVLAGVPPIMQGMMESLLPGLKGGAKVLSSTVHCEIPESRIAADLSALQEKYPHVDIGSYPKFKPGRTELSLVLRSTDAQDLRAATDELVEIVKAMGSEYMVETPSP